MTTAAKDAEPGKIYRLTRDGGTTYYRICDATTVRRLEKRLTSQNPRIMRADDRFTLDVLRRVRAGHVLGIRILRYRTDDGKPKELRAYVAFPPDYPLRQVERPPGYGSRLRGSTTRDPGATIEDEQEPSGLSSDVETDGPG